MVQSTMMKQPHLRSFSQGEAGRKAPGSAAQFASSRARAHGSNIYPSHPVLCSLLPEKTLGHAPGDASWAGNQLQLPFSPAAWSWGPQRCLQISMVRRSWPAEAVGTLFLLGWLAGAGGMESETCNSPGDFPPPALFPNISSAQEGDVILARCLVFSQIPITHIFFCKNGVELVNHPVAKGQFTSTLAIQLSAESSGTYSCGYQRWSHLGQVMFSRLSVPWLLSTRGGKDDPRNGSIATSLEPPAGALGVSICLAFAVFSLLALALGVHLLLQIGKRVQLARLKSFMRQ
ncbi:uncharacterized protein VSU04_015910 isoform 2-T2 [Chlamydotis macqueenii]